MAMARPDETAEVAGRSELPPLRGTEKQVAYAEKIRDSKLAQISNAMSNKLWNDRDNNNILALLPEKEQAVLSERCKDLEPKEKDELLLSTRDSILSSERMQKAVAAVVNNDNPKFWIDNKDVRVSEVLANQYRAVAPEILAAKEELPAVARLGKTGCLGLQKYAANVVTQMGMALMEWVRCLTVAVG